ncbi:MAG: 30S ribosomal protein S16 [bacterium]|nr:30S ribosomal protein S16 [bacterium]
MLSIRLLRTGKKNQPFYRMVVTDKKNPPRGGRFLEIVGFLNPFTKEKDIKADRIKHWISVGAKPSDTVHNILVKEKVIEAKKIAVHKEPKKKALEAKAKKVAISAEASASQSKPAPVATPAVEESKVVEETASEAQTELVKEEATPVEPIVSEEKPE